MRLSTDESDRGYKPNLVVYGIKVYVDGVLVPKVVTFDTEEGFATAVRCVFGVPVSDGGRLNYSRYTRRGIVTFTSDREISA
jgi:hypothetical protein